MAIRIPILTSFDPKGLRQANAQFAKLQTSIGSLGKNFAVAGAVLGAFGGASVKAFADFDAALTKSTAIMGDMSSKMRDQMSSAARDVAKATTFSAAEAAEAYFFLASAGLDAESSIAALPQVAKFAQAGMFDMALATDLLTDAQSALGMVIKGDSLANLAEMTRLSDVLVKANTLANASVQQFSEALTTKAGAALKAVNKDVTEGVAVLAAFADQGIKGAAAGTQFSIIMRDLTTKAIQNKNAFAAAGISVFDTAGNMNNLGEIIGDLEGALSGMSDETQKATLLQLGFSDKSLASLTALLGTSDAIKTYEASLRSASGFTDNVASKQLDTFNSQLELLKSAFVDVGISVGQQLEPALKGLIPQLKEALPLLGEKLVAAVKSVDWAGTVEAIGRFTVFLIENAEKIGKLVAAIFILNTAFKLMAVASGIAKTAIALHTYFVAQSAAGMTIATVAAGVLRTALLLLPWVAVAAGVALVITGITEADSSYRTATPNVTSFGNELLKSGKDAEWAAGRYGIATDSVNNFNRALSTVPKSLLDSEARRDAAMAARGAGLPTGIPGVTPTPLPGVPGVTPTPLPSVGGGAGGASAKTATSPLQQLLQESKRTEAVLKREGALERAGLTKEVAQWVTSSNKPIIAAREAQARIAKNGAKAVANLTKAYTKSAAGQQAAASAAAEASAQAQAAHNAMVAAAEAAAAREAAALAERERVYKAFQDSVVATFAGIKNAILGAFDLTQLGGSTNAITRNMDKLLTRLRSFATNVTKLSGMGLDPALLQQVIAAGPLAGARLAQTLVAGGANALNSINAGFNEFGALSSQIAQTGTESLFNRQAQQNIYNIEVSGGVGSGATIGKAIVDAIKSYERTSGAVFQGA
jgi:TP901 family phage tail tape measure protein